jgi:hypothetical protein
MKESWFRVHTSILDSRKFENLSLAARGLWVTIGALVKERGDPDGRLMRRDGSPLDAQRLSREIGYPISEVEPLLAELIDAGLLEYDTDGYLQMHDWWEWQVREDQREEWREQKRKQKLMRNGSNKPEGEEETEATEVPQVSATFQEVPQVSDAFQNVPYKTKTETKTKSENIVHSSSGANAPNCPPEIDQPQPVKAKKPRSLRLHIEHPPPEKPPKPDYFREVSAAFREVLGDDSDALAIRACLGAWKQVREGAHGIRGLSPEEITALWKQARSRASPDKQQFITLLWVLNNGEKARRLASWEPPPVSGSPPVIERHDIVEMVLRSTREGKDARPESVA